MTVYTKSVPKRNFIVVVPTREFQTIPDTVNRRYADTIQFTHWGQTDISLSSVLETFGELP